MNRILAAVDDRDAGRATVTFSAELAQRTGAGVCVVHVLEYVGRGCAVPLQSRSDADLIIERAVFDLRMAGVGAEGTVVPATRRRPSSLIIRASEQYKADVIIVGMNYTRGIGRLLGSGLREGVIRRSSVPVLVTPASFVHEIRIKRAGGSVVARGSGAA